MKLGFLENKKVSLELREVITNLCNNDSRYIEILNNLSDVFERNIETSVVIQIAQNIMEEIEEIFIDCMRAFYRSVL